MREALSKRTRRTNTEPWRALWNDCHPPASYPAPGPNAPARLARYVEIRTTGGERYKGLLISAGDTSSAHDVVIGDPLLWIESAWDWYSKGWKYLFVAGERIETIAFTNVETEFVHIGLLRDLITEPITEGNDARRESEPEAQPDRVDDEAGTGQPKS